MKGISLILLGLFLMGCATKGYVNDRTIPIEDNVDRNNIELGDIEERILLLERANRSINKYDFSEAVKRAAEKTNKQLGVIKQDLDSLIEAIEKIINER